MRGVQTIDCMTLGIVEQHPDRFFVEVLVNPFMGMPELRKLESLVKSHSHIEACSVAGF